MIHPDTELRRVSDNIGVGPFATSFIPRGTIAWILDRFDIVLSPARLAALPPPYAAIADRYSYLGPAGDSILCWDNARFMNHHCEPAVRGVTPQFQIAVRDVHPGEELTCEYAECNVDFLACHCGSPKCRREVRARDLIDHGAAWDAEVRAALPLVASVPQPLWKYLVDPDEVAGILEGRIAPFPMSGFYRAV